MEYRQLGGSGLRVSALSLGTATFAGGDRQGSWATRMLPRRPGCSMSRSMRA